jgi:hypothetical protein
VTGRFGFLREEHGSTGPLVVSDQHGVHPLLRGVRYERPGLAVKVSLVLSYMGEEYVTADLQTADSSGSGRRSGLRQITAHTGYQVRRGLDRLAREVQEALASRSGLEAG